MEVDRGYGEMEDLFGAFSGGGGNRAVYNFEGTTPMYLYQQAV
jgi:hypothetical protein